MRIAMVHPAFLARTGGERQILMLSLELQKLGHEVEIFTNYADTNTYPELFSKLRLNVAPVGLKFSRYVDKSAFLSMVLLERKITNSFDIINNHNYPTEWAAYLAKKRLKTPVVWMCNEPPFWYLHAQRKQGFGKFWPLFSQFDKRAVSQLDEILALSNFSSKAIREIYHRTPIVVRSGVNITFFHNASGEGFRRKHHLENDFVLLQVGTFIYYKRQEDSIIALAILSKKYSNVKLVLDGWGDQKNLKNLAIKLGVQDKIVFSHASSDEELATTYAACNVFLYPSDSTWGLVVTEAMAASKPIIVSKKSGTSEIISNNTTGFVVNHENPREIAARLEDLINNPNLLSDMGNNCYNYVKENLSWEKYAKKMENIFYQTIEHQSKSQKKLRCDLKST